MAIQEGGGRGRELLDILREYQLFSTLTPEQLREISDTAEVKDFVRGQAIVKQGGASTTFYLVLKGAVEIRRSDQVLARLGPGQFFGETALVRDSSYQSNVGAVERTSCLALSGAQLRSYPAVVLKVLDQTTHRNRTIVLHRAEDSPSEKRLAPIDDDELIGFKSAKTKLLFDTLVKCFTEDYMMKRLYLEQAGWRSVGELAAATKIPHVTLYGKHGNYGPLMGELVARGLIETRVFTGQRGRGGEILRARIAYDKEPVKRYVDRVVLRGGSDGTR